MILRLPRSRRIRVWQDRKEYGMDFQAFERAVRSGAIREDALVWSHVITRGIWVSAGRLKLYRIWHGDSLPGRIDLEKHNISPGREIPYPSAERIAALDQSFFRRVLTRLFPSRRGHLPYYCSQCRRPVRLTDAGCPWCGSPLREGYVETDFSRKVLQLEQDEVVEEIDIASPSRENQPP